MSSVVHAQAIRFGAWNAEWLGKPGSRSGLATNVAQTPQDIADYIKASKVDVLALEEVCADNAGPGTLRNKTLTVAFAKLKATTGQQWQYLLYPKPDKSPDQLLGIAWNTSKAKLVYGPKPLAVKDDPSRNIWRRFPYAVKLSFGQKKTDAVFITVHLKANSTRSGNTGTAPKESRRLEVDSFVRQLPALKKQFKDSDIVVLGDTNILGYAERTAKLFRDNGFVDLNSDDESTHLGGAPFDRIFVPKGQPEFRETREQIFDGEFMLPHRWTPDDFKRRLSDHFMVISSILVTRDDD